MQSRLSTLIHWISIVSLLGMGFLAIFLAYQSRSTRTVIIPALIVTPVSTPIPDAVELPSLDTPENSDVLTRGAQLHTYRPEKPRFKVTEYVVQKGDTAWSIANKYGLKPETLLWGNEGLNSGAGSLRVGTTINILPVDGVLHTVQEGDTLESLSAEHGVSIQEIIIYPENVLSGDISERLNPGEQVIIPNGKKTIAWQEPAGPPIEPVKGGKPIGSGVNSLASLYKGYFSWPVSPIIITQPYWSGHGGIDIGTRFRQPIFAAAGGTVVFSDWDTTGFGNLVIVDHGNGVLTYYGHNQANLVKFGQVVSRGQQLSESGSTGNSTGNHLDFRIKVVGVGYINPGDYLR
jgi:LysM repeat protein